MMTSSHSCTILFIRYLATKYSEEPRAFSFPGTARQEYCRFLKKGHADLLAGVLESAGEDSVSIFRFVTETLTQSWAKKPEGFKSMFNKFIAKTVATVADVGAETKQIAESVSNVKETMEELHERAEHLAEENKELIGQLWKGIKVFFQMCESPESALSLADDLLELLLSDLVVSKLEEAFPTSKPLKFIRDAKRIMDELSNCKLGEFFFLTAAGAADVDASGLFSAVLHDMTSLETIFAKKIDAKTMQYKKIVDKAQATVKSIFDSEAGEQLYTKFINNSKDVDAGDLLKVVLSEIFGRSKEVASAAAQAADTVEDIADTVEDMQELKRAFEGKLEKYLLPRIQDALGLPSGLNHIKSAIAVKCKFVTGVLAPILISDSVEDQVAAFKEMWEQMIQTSWPTIIEDILSGFPLGQSKHPKPLWPPIVLSADAQIELAKAKANVERVIGDVMEAMVSVVLAIISPIMEGVNALNREHIESISLGLEMFQAILKFVQGGDDAMDSATTLAYAVGLKFGMHRKLLDGLISIFNGNFSPTTARAMAPVLMGTSSSAQAATEAICSLVGLAQGDWSQLKALAVKMGGYDEKQLEELAAGIARLKPILEKLKKQADTARKELNGADTLFDKDDNDLDPNALFLKFDKDNSGSLEFNEFLDVVKVINYPQQITEDKVMKIFVSADVSKTGALDLVEFTRAIDMSRAQQSNRVLELLHLSKGNMITIILTLLVILIVLFGFIFAGIVAFTTLGGFSAVVNSVFPVIGGAGASNSAEVPGDNADEGQTGQMLDSMLEKANAEDTVAE